MLPHLAVIAALGVTLTAPAPPASEPVTAAPSAVTFTIPLIRETFGPSYTATVDQRCPDSHPYVHTDRWVGELPAGISFIPTYWDARDNGSATRIRGLATNWNPISSIGVSLDLRCTSDPKQGVRIS